MSLYIHHTWGKIGNTRLYSRQKVTGKGGCLSSCLYLIFLPIILIFYLFKFIIVGIFCAIGLFSGNAKAASATKAPVPAEQGKKIVMRTDVGQFFKIVGGILLFVIAFLLTISFFNGKKDPQEPEEPTRGLVMEAPETEEPQKKKYTLPVVTMEPPKKEAPPPAVYDPNISIKKTMYATENFRARLTPETEAQYKDIVYKGTELYIKSVNKDTGWAVTEYNGNRIYAPWQYLTEEVPAEPAAPAAQEYALSISVTSPVYNGNYATVTAKGKPGATYSITVTYGTTESTAKGLGDKTADANGNVSWSWMVGRNTTSGTQSVSVRNVNDYSDRASANFETIK